MTSHLCDKRRYSEPTPMNFLSKLRHGPTMPIMGLPKIENPRYHYDANHLRKILEEHEQTEIDEGKRLVHDPNMQVYPNGYRDEGEKSDPPPESKTSKIPCRRVEIEMKPKSDETHTFVRKSKTLTIAHPSRNPDEPPELIYPVSEKSYKQALLDGKSRQEHFPELGQAMTTLESRSKPKPRYTFGNGHLKSKSVERETEKSEVSKSETVELETQISRSENVISQPEPSVTEEAPKPDADPTHSDLDEAEPPLDFTLGESEPPQTPRRDDSDDDEETPRRRTSRTESERSKEDIEAERLQKAASRLQSEEDMEVEQELIGDKSQSEIPAEELTPDQENRILELEPLQSDRAEHAPASEIETQNPKPWIDSPKSSYNKPDDSHRYAQKATKPIVTRGERFRQLLSTAKKPTAESTSKSEMFKSTPVSYPTPPVPQTRSPRNPHFPIPPMSFENRKRKTSNGNPKPPKSRRKTKSRDQIQMKHPPPIKITVRNTEPSERQIDRDDLKSLTIPKIPMTPQNGFDQLLRIINAPRNVCEAGLLFFDNTIRPQSQYSVSFMSGVDVGTFAVCNRNGKPIAYASIMFEQNNPRQFVHASHFAQFNPLQHPIFAMLTNYDCKPPQVFYYLTLSKFLEPDDYRLARLPIKNEPDRHMYIRRCNDTVGQPTSAQYK